MVPKSLCNLQLAEQTETSPCFRLANKNTFSATTVKIKVPNPEPHQEEKAKSILFETKKSRVKPLV